MQIFKDVCKKVKKLPLAGYDPTDYREYVQGMLDRGLAAFSAVLNQERIYLPVGYLEHVFYDVPCEMRNIRCARIPIETYAEAVYAALCGMHAVWVDWHQKDFSKRPEYGRFFLPLSLHNQCAVDAFLGVWCCIMNDLEQYRGDHPVIDFWKKQQALILRQNQINSAEALAAKISSESLEFDYRSGFCWAKQLRDVKVADEVARIVITDLADVMREVNS